jgi:hypothetical protein
MNVVRGHSAARWLPSRFHFALFRLSAYLYLRFAKPDDVRENVVLAIDRDQSTLENYGIAIWVVLTTTCYVSAALFPSWPVAAALLVSLPIAVIVLQLPLIVIGLVFRNRNNIALISKIMMLALTVIAVAYATSPLWIRFVAWHFLALVILDGAAAVVAFVLRQSMARLEESFAG